MDIDDFTPLVPVNEWVYNLYRIDYLTEEGGRVICSYNLADTATHVQHTAEQRVPRDCTWMQWTILRENVGHPRVVGSMHGVRVHEDGWSHARNLMP